MGMYYWVMQELSGSLIAHGPYKTSSARDNRFEKVFGGEVHRFDSFSSDPDVVKREFRDEQLGGL